MEQESSCWAVPALWEGKKGRVRRAKKSVEDVGDRSGLGPGGGGIGDSGAH